MKYFITTLIIILAITTGVIHNDNNIKEIENEIQELKDLELQNNKVETTMQIIEFEEPQMPLYNIPLELELQQLIWEECNKYSLSYELVLAVIKQESRFDHQAISQSGRDKGLFQLNINTYPWIAEQINIEDFNVLNPHHNIKAGVWYLNYLRDYWAKGYSDEEVMYLTLNSYNQGIGGCTKYTQQYGHTYYYAIKVLNYKEGFEKEFINSSKMSV